VRPVVRGRHLEMSENPYSRADLPTSGSDRAVRRELLTVPGVRSVDIAPGEDPYTVRVTVDGGDDQAIAEALYDALPVGIGTRGRIRVEVDSGSQWAGGIMVAFDRPINLADVYERIDRICGMATGSTAAAVACPDFD
jgi:hypothetical protein